MLPTDWSAPSTATLKRITDPRAHQFWDKERLLSHAMGERDRSTIVWDFVAVYPPNELWQDTLPQSTFSDRPVVRVIPGLREAIARLSPAVSP